MDEIGLVFHRERDALTLENMAANRVALTVWQREIINYPLNRDLPSSSKMMKKFNIEYNSSIPPRLRDMIDQCLPRIREELENWADRTYCYLYSKDVEKRDTWIKYFDKLAWSAEDFSIDDAETCLNLFWSDGFSKKEKFEMASLYCFEHHMEEFWADDLYEDDDLSFDHLYEDHVPWALRYWISRMRNLSYRDIANTFSQIELSYNVLPNRWFIGYFWRYLAPDFQAEVVIELIRAKDPSCLRYFLPKLSEISLQRILRLYGESLLKILIENEKCRPLAVPFWNHVKHSFDANQFLETMDWMLQFYYHPSRRMSEDEISLSLQIWTSAPQQLKEHAIQTYSLEFIDPSLYTIPTRAAINDSGPYCDVRLLKMVLSYASAEQRDRLWRANWLSFCSHVKKSDMNALIEYCLPDANERMQFKLQNMTFDKIKDYCFSLLRHMEFGTFNDFVEFFSADPDAGIELKRLVLKSYFLETYFGRRKVYLYFEHIDEVKKIIEGCIPAATEQCSRLGKEFLSSIECSNRLVKCMQEGEFSLIKKLVIACLPIDQDRLEWKEQFKHHCHQCLTTLSFRQFNQSQWQDFMMWCLGNEEKIIEFKRSLNLDEILDLFLQRCETKSETRGFHKNFEEFLNWCLDSKGVDALKRKYVEANPDNDKIHGLLFSKKRRC